jgi:hypothetical protein
MKPDHHNPERSFINICLTRTGAFAIVWALRKTNLGVILMKKFAFALAAIAAIAFAIPSAQAMRPPHHHHHHHHSHHHHGK